MLDLGMDVHSLNRPLSDYVLWGIACRRLLNVMLGWWGGQGWKKPVLALGLGSEGRRITAKSGLRWQQEVQKKGDVTVVADKESINGPLVLVLP